MATSSDSLAQLYFSLCDQETEKTISTADAFAIWTAAISPPASGDEKKKSGRVFDYSGDDVHAYTKQMAESARYCRVSNETIHPPTRVTDALDEISKTFGAGVAAPVDNIRRNYKDGRLDDKDVPGFNFAWLVLDLWGWKDGRDAFKDSLIEVQNTCVQGITHRLLYLRSAMM